MEAFLQGLIGERLGGLILMGELFEPQLTSVKVPCAPLGGYWRIRLLVFSLEPHSHELHSFSPFSIAVSVNDIGAFRQQQADCRPMGPTGKGRRTKSISARRHRDQNRGIHTCLAGAILNQAPDSARRA
jgi:hypothetical protein